MSERRPRTEAELVEFIHALDTPAPAALHERVQRMADEHARGRPRRPRALGRQRLTGRGRLAWSAAIVIVLVAVALAASRGGDGRFTVGQASALTLRAATMSAPSESPRVRSELTRTAAGIAFPNWSYAFGFRASGTRVDHLDGRTITTVFYTNARAQRVGYAIVAGAPAVNANAGQLQWRTGTPYRTLSSGGANVVSWFRDGRLCVIAARGVPSATLVALASWPEQRS